MKNSANMPFKDSFCVYLFGLEALAQQQGFSLFGVGSIYLHLSEKILLQIILK